MICRLALRLLCLLFLFPFLVAAQSQQPAEQVQFHGTYEELKPAQKKLIDDWYAEYNRMANDHSQPTEYNDFSLSTRTTFEAVTHALMTTNLTDKSGKSMGNALDLVQGIEAINGKVPRARGDLQFRIYVLLKPDAVQTLKASSEFFRDRDNTVYHKGYPLNYRQDGGAPSIQISIAKDGLHADIDVDYRSSQFPSALFNGHLSAANSDVRAGNNTQKHNQRWQGLPDWWRSLFGLSGSSEEDAVPLKAGDIPPFPRKGDGKLEDAVQDFLSSWLVEQKPELAAAYLSPQSFPCLQQYGPQSGQPVNAGIAPYLAAKDMAATNLMIGKVSAVSDAIKPSSLDAPGIKRLNEGSAVGYSLYQLSNAAAAEFECDPEKAYGDFDQARTTGTGAKYGRYFAAVFRLNAPKGKSDAITLLWTKESKIWKVVAWEIEPEERAPGAIPDTRRRQALAKTKPARAGVHADPAFLQASHDFLHSWFVEDNFDHAATYISTRCNDCVDLYLGEGKQPPSSPTEYAAFLRNALTTVGKDVGKVNHLHDALEPVMPDHDDLQLVTHAGEGAYTVVAVPDYLASSFLCVKTSASRPYQPPDGTQQKTYGNYYATMFALRTPGEHPAALTLLWAKDQGAWKIVAYDLTTM